ncbi:Ead/Ea22-like family protein [Enterobacter intestinihominis]
MSNIDKQALRQTAEKAQEHGVFNMDIHSQTVLALLDELEAKDAQIANLTAERDALREGEMGDAKHSNTRTAADIYFQLVEECEIPAGGSLVEYVSELRERAAAGKGE